MAVASTSSELQGRATARLSIYASTIALISFVGLVLRVIGAHGDLWLDEIWSLQSLEHLSRPDEIFWRISKDNNHYLTSAWLWFARDSSSSVCMRGLSIAFGTASIPLGACIARRHGGDLAGYVAGVLLATSYVFVHYGSEARGYAGMIFALLWAWDALDRYAASGSEDRTRWVIIAAIALGGLSQLTALPAMGLLVASFTARLALASGSRQGALRVISAMASAYILGAAPAALSVFFGALVTRRIQLGELQPFSVDAWVQGVASLFRSTLGIPTVVGDLATLSATLVLSVLALAMVKGWPRVLAVSMLASLPAIELLLRAPNLHIPRFHLTLAVALILLLADAFAAAWKRAGLIRAVSSACAAAIVLGNASATADFFAEGRGSYGSAMQVMGAGGPSATASNSVAETGRVVRYLATQAHLPVTYVDDVAAADWYIFAEDNRRASEAKPAFEIEDSKTTARFARIVTFPYAGLSGFRWTLYKRQ